MFLSERPESPKLFSFWWHIIERWTQTMALINLWSKCFKRIGEMQSTQKYSRNSTWPQHTPTCNCPVDWGCRIHQVRLNRGVRPPPTSVPYMTLNNLMVRFQKCWNFGECGIPTSLPSLPGPLWNGVVAPNRTSSILLLNWIVWVNWIAWNRNAFDN